MASLNKYVFQIPVTFNSLLNFLLASLKFYRIQNLVGFFLPSSFFFSLPSPPLSFFKTAVALLSLSRPQIHHLQTIMSLGCEEGPSNTGSAQDCQRQLKPHIFKRTLLFLCNIRMTSEPWFPRQYFTFNFSTKPLIGLEPIERTLPLKKKISMLHSREMQRINCHIRLHFLHSYAGLIFSLQPCF